MWCVCVCICHTTTTTTNDTHTHLLQAQRLADVHEVEDVLLEAAAAKAHAGVEELVADAAVHADGAHHLVVRVGVGRSIAAVRRSSK